MTETALSALIRNCRRITYFMLGAVCLSAWAPASGHVQTPIIHAETREKTFENVVFDLEFAITQRNFRITGHNDIGRGIRARGVKDFPQAMIIHFCNLTLAQEALELDPLFITHMPCRVAVYDHGERITVTTTSLPEDSDDPRVNAFSRKLNAMLRAILNFAVQ